MTKTDKAETYDAIVEMMRGDVQEAIVADILIELDDDVKHLAGQAKDTDGYPISEAYLAGYRSAIAMIKANS